MVLDSNILIYSVEPQHTSLRSYLIQNQSGLSYSEISYVEVLGYHLLPPAKQVALEQYFGTLQSLPVSNAVIQEATRLRQQRKMSLGDAIIAATCLLHNEPLLTNNEADFQHLPTLTVIPMRTVL